MEFPIELDTYVPHNSIPLLKALWKKYPFHLRVSPARQTKSGDYRYLPGQVHLISINRDLNEFQFLFTLVHEIAHQWVQIEYKRRQAPHGKAWKEMFKKLIKPFINLGVFDYEMEKEIIRHMRNPKASTSADQKLYLALKNDIHSLILENISDGSTFRLGKRLFVKGPKRRTRFLCYSIPENKKYTISALAAVELVSADPS